jgi:beta-N-acetylhexosaminidase
MGLFGERGGIADTAEADRIPHDREIVATATEAADKSIVLMRDDAETLPLNREQRVLVVEQTFVTQVACNNAYSHPGLLWEELSRHSPAVGSIEISDLPADGDMARLRKRLAEDEFDVIVTTNYFHYKIAAGICEVVDELLATGKPVVVVANNPFAFSVKAHYPTVVVCYNPAGRENMGAVADILYGAKKAVGKLPVKL